jgi:hypothetical protein
MIVEADRTYSGLIDWNAVYRKYYQLDSIEHRLLNYLQNPCRITFSGFGEIANRLSKLHHVHFIEYSDSMVRSARREFPEIAKISNANIVDVLEYEKTQVLFVVCRITAYWRRINDLQKFIVGVKRAPKEIIVVDFFHKGKIESGGALGNLEFSEIKQIQNTEKPRETSDSISIQLATVHGSYTTDGKSHAYHEVRAFYDPNEVRYYFAARMDGYGVSVEPPIVDGDPGFTLVLRKRANA